MIKPTIGRVVWYYPSDEDSGRFATWMPYQIGQAKKNDTETAKDPAA